MVMEVARGERGAAPDTVTFLSGDVHNSYLAELTDPHRHGATSRVVQAVCSPIRNPMPRGVRAVMSLFAKSLVRPMRFVASRSRRVPDPAYPWTVTDGPWFDNNLALVTVGRGRAAPVVGHGRRRRRPGPPAARAGVRRAPGSAGAGSGTRGPLGVRSGFSTRAEHRGGRLALAGQGPVPGAASSRPDPAGPPALAPKDHHDARRRHGPWHGAAPRRGPGRGTDEGLRVGRDAGRRARRRDARPVRG